MAARGAAGSPDGRPRRALATGAVGLIVAAGLAAATGDGMPGEPLPHPSCAWTFLGPLAVPHGEGYDGTRVPVSGRVTSLALDEDDPRTVYLGAALGGVWKSSDGGDTWRPVSDGAGSPAIGALAADPLQPGRVYAGTGEANLAFRRQLIQGDRPLSGAAGDGLLLSDDGGVTWRRVGGELFAGEAFVEIAVSAHRAALLLAATTGGLFRSRDGGETWERLSEGLPSEPPRSMATSVVFHPRQPGVAYAAFWADGVYRSDDIAADEPRWTRSIRGFPLSNVSRIGLAASAAAGDDLYAYVADAESRLRGLYRSQDRGERWQRIPEAPDLMQGQGFFNLLVAAHPTQPAVIFLGGAGDRRDHASSFFRGALIGDAWRFVPLGGEVHIDFHALVFHPLQPDTLFVGTDGGVWRTDNGGRGFRALNHGLPILQFNRIDQHPTSGAMLVGGTQDNGTLMFRGSAVWEHGDDGDGGFVAIDPRDPEVVYNEFTLYKVGRSAEAGRYGTFRPIFPELKGVRSVFYAPFALDPGQPRVLALGLDRVYLSHDGGESWGMITIDLSRGWTSRLQTNAISSLAFPRSDLLYAGTSDGKVWRLDLRDDGWQARELRAPEGKNPGGYVSDLATPPGRPDLLYAAFSEGPEPALLRAETLSPPGVSEAAPPIAWEEAAGTAPHALPASGALAIEVEPLAPTVLYAATDAGVYRSADSGATWRAFSAGLPDTSIHDLQRHPALPLLRAATHGRGVWELDLSGDPCPEVELYVRDSAFDQGRTWERFTPPGDRPARADSPDLKVVAATGTPGEEAIDYVRFHVELLEEAPAPGRPQRVYAHLANRGPRPSGAVAVRLFAAAAAEPPAVRMGPGAPGAAWREVGVREASGIAPDAPQVVVFDWTPESGAAAYAHLLLVVEEEGGAILGRGSGEMPARRLASGSRLITLETVELAAAAP